jgi:putative ABC transport system permease protein
VEVLMRLGLVIGLLSLGIVGLRAVVERRRVIGVLRALGYRRRSVLVGLVAEATLTATLGTLIGFATGAVMGYLFLLEFVEDTPYGIDGPSMGTALGLLYVAVVLVSLGPAWQASHQPPAEAVRYVE